MAQFEYRAIDQHSKVSSGVLVADSLAVLEGRISDLGLWLIEAKEVTRTTKTTKLKANASRRDLADFFDGLATLLGAGIDLAESLRVLVSEVEDPGFQRALEDVRINMESGASLYDALSAHGDLFSIDIRNLVRAGEHAGKLVEACQDISRHLEWMDQLVGDIKQATMYPTMISIAVFALVMVMFTFVVPQFSLVFDSLDMELPGITLAVIAIGEFCTNYWWLILLGITLLGGGLYLGPRYSATFAIALDWTKLKAPVFGELNKMLLLSTFTHNMALMLKAGVPILESIQLVSGLVRNRVMARILVNAEQAVTEGRKMSEALDNPEIISPLVMRMVVVGEETGNLDKCLEKVSQHLDREVPRRIKRLFGILEPTIIMVLLGIVGAVAAAIFLPLFSLMSGIG